MTAAPIILLAALSTRTVTLAEAERAAEAQRPSVRVATANTAAVCNNCAVWSPWGKKLGAK